MRTDSKKAKRKSKKEVDSVKDRQVSREKKKNRARKEKDTCGGQEVNMIQRTFLPQEFIEQILCEVSVLAGTGL